MAEKAKLEGTVAEKEEIIKGLKSELTECASFKKKIVGQARLILGM